MKLAIIGSYGHLGTVLGALKELPDVRLVEIPDAGHVVNLAQPKAFSAALEAFLDELDARDPA